MIIDPRFFNRSIRRKSFRMETIQLVINLLMPGDFLATLDLKDAYLHIPIHPGSRRFLRIAVQVQGILRHYQFVALPFGISSAPHTFTKVVVSVVAALRLQGLCIVPYLDYWILKAFSQAILSQHIQTTVSFLYQLGWIINLNKSNLQPATSVRFLGFMIDSVAMTIHLTPERKLRVQDTAQSLLVPKRETLPYLMRMVGLMSATVETVPWALWHLRPLQSEVLAIWNPSREELNSMHSLSPQVQSSLRWWIHLQDNQSLIQPVWIILTTDASLMGWGVHLLDKTGQGTWSPQEKMLS
ncbi:uncharacterized protein LOC130357228 [Hyla sarda]|uniref:uncharacterized protein LOC130357228 n=1 Tax=Hyla sarda TaxID=327740 RepID=UPI0024C2EC61|nr:uncharacterized protein LOC130357228 [Hyla sarda]